MADEKNISHEQADRLIQLLRTCLNETYHIPSDGGVTLTFDASGEPIVTSRGYRFIYDTHRNKVLIEAV